MTDPEPKSPIKSPRSPLKSPAKSPTKESFIADSPADAKEVPAAVADEDKKDYATPAPKPKSKITEPGTIVWAKLRGSPWWPSRVESESDLSEAVLSKKPPIPDVFAVYFFGSRDYGWITEENLKPFQEYREEFTKKSKKGQFAAAMEDVLEYMEPGKHSGRSSEKKKRKSMDSGESAPAKRKKRMSTASAPPAPEPEPEAELDEEGRLFRLRKKLQKFFLDAHSEALHFEKADRYLKEVEQLKELNIEAVKNTKIGKIIRRISEMELPGDTFSIASRCSTIVEKWNAEFLKAGKVDAMEIDNSKDDKISDEREETEKQSGNVAEETEKPSDSVAIADKSVEEKKERNGDVVTEDKGPEDKGAEEKVSEKKDENADKNEHSGGKKEEAEKKEEAVA